MIKHLRRIGYGILVIAILSILLICLGYKSDSNSDADPLLRAIIPFLETLLVYILGTGVESLLAEC